jgi:hypothetical protein
VAFLEASEGVVELFSDPSALVIQTHNVVWSLTRVALGLLGKSAFIPVKNDLAGNITVSFKLSFIIYFVDLFPLTRKSVLVMTRPPPNPPL